MYTGAGVRMRMKILQCVELWALEQKPHFGWSPLHPRPHCSKLPKQRKQRQVLVH